MIIKIIYNKYKLINRLERMFGFMKTNKKLLILGMLLIVVLSMVACESKPEGAVAKIGDELITEEEFNADFQVFKNIYEQQLGEGALAQTDANGNTLEATLKESIIEKIIMERIVEKESKALNIEVTQEEIDAELNSYTVAMNGEEDFNKFLESNNMTKEFFIENLRKEILLEKHKEYIMKDLEVTEKETEKYFEEYEEDLVVVKASHILVKTEEEGKAILERLNSGEDFAKVAEEASIDQASATQGGDLGYFAKGQMIAEFENAAFALNVGEVSDLVKTEVGYHIIKLADKKDTYDALKDDISLLLKEDKYLEELQKLRDKSKVKIYLD